MIKYEYAGIISTIGDINAQKKTVSALVAELQQINKDVQSNMQGLAADSFGATTAKVAESYSAQFDGMIASMTQKADEDQAYMKQVDASLQ